jgi:hypothetical protein
MVAGKLKRNTRWVCLYPLALIAGAAQFGLCEKDFSLTALAANFPLFGQSCSLPNHCYVTTLRGK